MNPLIILFWVLQLIFVPLFIKSGWPESKKSTLLIKMVCSTVFVGYALYGILSCGAGFDSRYRLFVFVGLILGWAGDIFMTFDPFLKGRPKAVSDGVAVLGGVFFLAGHIFYIAAFIKEGKGFGAVFFITFIAVMLALAVVKKVLKLNLGKFTVPVVIYAVMLDIMFSSAINLGVNAGTQALMLTGAGALLFLSSDFTLGLKIFDGERFNTLPVRTVYIATYYIAQMLIAASAAVL